MLDDFMPTTALTLLHSERGGGGGGRDRAKDIEGWVRGLGCDAPVSKLVTSVQ